MINLMIKNIFENSKNIDKIVEHVNKVNKRNCLNFALIGFAICLVTIVIEKHDQRIEELETQLEEMKSKGE